MRCCGALAAPRAVGITSGRVRKAPVRGHAGKGTGAGGAHVSAPDFGAALPPGPLNAAYRAHRLPSQQLHEAQSRLGDKTPRHKWLSCHERSSRISVSLCD